MAHVNAGHFNFYAQTSVLWNFWNFGGEHRSSRKTLSWTGKSKKKDPIQHIPLHDLKSDSLKELDKIGDLPGLHFDPGFDQYAGYFTVNKEHHRNMFYWYVESQGDPDTDPVIFWTNGGPGCSGLYAFIVEHGPFQITKNGKLFENPFSWNKRANMIYVESPVGVGFSFSDFSDDYKTGDAQTAIDNYIFIRQFLDRFPERQSNDFYIASESYGGHYMPQLIKEILARNEDGAINFKGMMVGNPYVDPFTNDVTQFQTWYDHGLLPWPLYRSYVKFCHDRKNQYTTRCLDYMDMMYDEMGKGINPYGLDYPVCLEKKFNYDSKKDGSAETDPVPMSDSPADGTYVAIYAKTGEIATDAQNSPINPKITLSSQATQLMNQTSVSYGDIINRAPPFTPPGDMYFPCQSNHLTAYMNRPDVVKAIHANIDTLPWKACTDRIHYSLNDNLTPQIDLYAEVLQMMKETPFDMMVYSGDDDSICSLAGTQAWIWDIGATWKEKNVWNPWTVGNQTAGYLTQFDVPRSTTGEKGSFSLVTIHGAGHEVPAYRPMESFEMLTAFLSGKWRL
ncbi:serine carboxypeptidase [Nitzschia inconspicua]|uniref:Carboxypeptidase n=1 Tax=Nitzschia inconspicua TaxID=303405 RepID=A0A9K3KTS2_9STRA|nr:serine carboxypeptidase [Nitzschia inconspicua]